MRVIFFIFLLIRGTHLSCQLWGKFSSSALAKDGDITFGGIFTLHYKGATPAVSYSAGPLNPGCVGFNLRAFRWAQGMIFAIEEINQDEYLLPNITLGYKIHDSCANPPEALRATLSLVNGEEDISILNSTCKDQSVAAVIGCSGSTQSITIARILGSFGIPQISYFSSCACLSDKHEFPTFFRTIPSDYFQVQAWVKVVKHFGWTWIGAFGSDDAYGHFGIQSFLEEIKKIDACIAFAEYFPAVYTKGKIQEHIELIKKSKAKVILVFATEIDMYILANELLKQNVTGIVWLASESWATAGLLSTKEMFGTLGGLLGLGIQRSSIKGIKDFLLRIHPADYPGNVYIKEFWETTFKYVSQLRITYNTYKAVYAIAHALHNVLFCENNTKVCHSVKEIEPWKVSTLCKVQFKVKTGDEIQFDHNGDPRPSYDIINWQLDVNGDVQYVDIGNFTLTKQELSDITTLDFIMEVITSSCSESCPPGTRKATREGEPICCFDCVPCAQDEISNSTDSIDCIRCPWNHWPNSMKNTCLPKAVEYLSFGEMMGIILSALGVAGACLTVFVAAVFFHFRSTPIVRANNSEISFLLLFSLLLCFLCSFLFIGEPSHWSCKLKHAAFGITFVLCISCVLGKTLVVIMAFKSTLPGHNIMKCFGPLQQRLKNTKYFKNRIIFECNLGSVAAFCFVLAFIGRKLPDNFNEAKYITFSMLIFCAVWITFIPAYLSSPGKYTVAVEVFAILSSSFGVLLCIFAPKCYIILLRPETNTKKHVMGRSTSSAKI
uniref:Extracellular calcium-sensing receptor-like n=1 Tax=Erpetoichthys calabaricus TaxID=27687 RepID=A0A8C4X784_ERPCA